MPFKQIVNNLYLGDQFSNQIKAHFQLKISNIYYDILANQTTEEILVLKKMRLWKLKRN